jgi:hypothetical protein
MSYNAMDPRSFEAADPRQFPKPPLVEFPKKRVGDVIPGDSIFDDFPGVWRGVILVEEQDKYPGHRRVLFEDGGGFLMPHDIQISYDADSIKGWSSPEIAAIWRRVEVLAL